MTQETFVYAVYRNLDMTEGRGPMVLDRIYSSKPSAEEYANAQLGIMGREPPIGGWTAQKYGDWEVRPLILYP